MSFFNRRNDQQTTTATSPEAGAQAEPQEQQGKVMTPTMPPGVVPPPAAPVYSMKRPEPPRFDDAEVPVSESVRVAAEARRRVQEGMQGRLEVDVRRQRTAAPVARSVPQRRAMQQPVPVAPRATRPYTPQPIDPTRIAQTGLLNLAWSWQRAGAPIRAIHAYMQLLERYPGTPAATAAVADLVEISDHLARHGQFHIALGIYDQLEELLAC